MRRHRKPSCCMVQQHFLLPHESGRGRRRRSKKLGPCIESINQNRLSESRASVVMSVVWKIKRKQILKAYFNQQGAFDSTFTSFSLHCRCLVGNCATCIVRSFSFVFFIDFCSFYFCLFDIKHCETDDALLCFCFARFPNGFRTTTTTGQLKQRDYQKSINERVQSDDK